MSSTPLDFSLSNLGTIKTEVDAGLSALISALDVVEKFANFLPGGIGADVTAAVSVLTELKSLVDKFA
jgi:hypothetical protein